MGALSQINVAQLAGVSRSTVSMALADDPRIALKTKRRVREVANRLGYHVNLNVDARRMGARKAGRALATGMIGLVWAGAGGEPYEGSFYHQLLDGIIAGAWEEDQTLCLFRMGIDDDNKAARISQADGLILPSTSHHYHNMARRLGKPLVTVLSGIEDPTVTDVTVDNGKVMRLAFDHLWQAGHRAIGYLGPSNTAKVPTQRWIEYCNCLSTAGVPYDDNHVVVHHEETFRAKGATAMRQLWQHERRPTAVIVYNDMMALGVLDAARELGVRVPEDLSIVGIDDISEAATNQPALTTVSIDIAGLGRRVVQRLAGMVRTGRYEGGTVLLEPSLKPRATVAPPRGKDN